MANFDKKVALVSEFRRVVAFADSYWMRVVHSRSQSTKGSVIFREERRGETRQEEKEKMGEGDMKGRGDFS